MAGYSDGEQDESQRRRQRQRRGQSGCGEISLNFKYLEHIMCDIKIKEDLDGIARFQVCS